MYMYIHMQDFVMNCSLPCLVNGRLFLQFAGRSLAASLALRSSGHRDIEPSGATSGTTAELGDLAAPGE